MATSGRVSSNTAPTNLGAVVGYAVNQEINSNNSGGAAGQFGTWLGAANDAITLFADPYKSAFNAPNGVVKSINTVGNNASNVPLKDVGDALTNLKDTNEQYSKCSTRLSYLLLI